MRRRSALLGLAVILTGVGAGGCATSTPGAAPTAASREEVEAATEAARIAAERASAAERQRRLAEASPTARDAFRRAAAGGRLAIGELLFEAVLSDDTVPFAFDETRLSPEARAALDGFASELRAAGAGTFVEIQGHTDSTGGAAYNLRLGRRRAEAVRRYLQEAQGVPLDRMSVFSYGETAPIADNGTRRGRARNRRVSLVVLR